MEASTFEQLLTTDEMFFVNKSRYLAGLAARMKVPLCDVEDLAQEAWLSVIQHLAQL
jgi:DNA-directed RNA polymerase specialized sigma24 family protein